MSGGGGKVGGVKRLVYLGKIFEDTVLTFSYKIACDIKQPHLILKMAPSSVIHHVKVDVNIISTK